MRRVRRDTGGSPRCSVCVCEQGTRAEAPAVCVSRGHGRQPLLCVGGRLPAGCFGAVPLSAEQDGTGLPPPPAHDRSLAVLLRASHTHAVSSPCPALGAFRNGLGQGAQRAQGSGANWHCWVNMGSTMGWEGQAWSCSVVGWGHVYCHSCASATSTCWDGCFV